MRNILSLVLVFVLFLPLSLLAETTKVYTWTDEDGQIHFTDQPREGAEELEVEEAPTFRSAPPEVREQLERFDRRATDEGTGYDRFEILRPEDEATLRDNLGQVPVSLAVEPELRAGHRILIKVNGEPWGDLPETRSTTFTLNGVHRGEHHLQLSIVDQHDQVLATASSTFYMHQASRLIRPDR